MCTPVFCASQWFYEMYVQCKLYIAIHLYFSVEINNSSDFVGGNIFCRLVLCDNKWANAKITSESEMSIVTDAIGYLAEVEILRSVRTMM